MAGGRASASGSKTRYKQIAVAAVLLVGTTVVFVIIGATGNISRASQWCNGEMKQQYSSVFAII